MLRMFALLLILSTMFVPAHTPQAIAQPGGCLAAQVALGTHVLTLCTTTGVIDGYDAVDSAYGADMSQFAMSAPFSGYLRTFVIHDGMISGYFDQMAFQGVATPAAALAALEASYAVENMVPVGAPTLTINGQMLIGRSFLSSVAAQPEETSVTLISYWSAAVGEDILLVEIEAPMPDQTDVAAMEEVYTSLSLTSQTVNALFLPLVQTSGVSAVHSVSAPDEVLTDLPTPSWWNGDCDTHNYRSQTGKNAYWLGHSYRGVKACGPRPNYDRGAPSPGPVVRFFPGAYGQYEWQCVELVMRYMYLAYGTHPYPGNGNKVYLNYTGQTGVRLQKIPNKTAGKYPKPGDVISYSGQYGHAAIVVESAVDSAGNGWYTTLNQNSAQTLSGRQAIRNWDAHAIGWLHDARTDAPPPWPSPIPNRWRAEYRPSHTLSAAPTWVQIEAGIDYHWGAGAPGGAGWQLPSDGFSVVWEGAFDFLALPYTFSAGADDQVTVYLDGQLLLDTSLTTIQVTRAMTAGRHTLRVEYRELGGLTHVAFNWVAAGPIADPAPLPASGGDGFGTAIVTGDFNGDSLADIAVGAPGEDIAGAADAGQVYLFQGTLTGTLPLRALDQTGLGGNEAGDLFGARLAVGDLNADGFDDLVVGAPGETPGGDPRAGYVMLFKGGSGGLTPWQGLSEAPLNTNDLDDRFGYALAVGDFDNDSIDDLAVAAPNNAPVGSPRSGTIFTYRGGTTQVTPWAMLAQPPLGSNEVEDRFGTALASGDFNGDGFADLAVGAPGEVPDASQSGFVFLFNGAADGLQPWHGVKQVTLGADEYDDRFGATLAAGDLDQDGLDDLIVGAPGEAPGAHPQSGYVFVFRGGGTALQPWYGLDQTELGVNETDDRFGAALALGDLNGDTYPELIVGAPGEAPGAQPRGGYAFVFRNDTGQLVPWRGLEQSGLGSSEAGDLFGSTLAIVDLGGDGFTDVLSGGPGEAPLADPPSGYGFVFRGTPRGPLPWYALDQTGLDQNE